MPLAAVELDSCPLARASAAGSVVAAELNAGVVKGVAALGWGGAVVAVVAVVVAVAVVAVVAGSVVVAAELSAAELAGASVTESTYAPLRRRNAAATSGAVTASVVLVAEPEALPDAAEVATVAGPIAGLATCAGSAGKPAAVATFWSAPLPGVFMLAAGNAVAGMPIGAIVVTAGVDAALANAAVTDGAAVDDAAVADATVADGAAAIVAASPIGVVAPVVAPVGEVGATPETAAPLVEALSAALELV